MTARYRCFILVRKLYQCIPLVAQQGTKLRTSSWLCGMIGPLGHSDGISPIYRKSSLQDLAHELAAGHFRPNSLQATDICPPDVRLPGGV